MPTHIYIYVVIIIIVISKVESNSTREADFEKKGKSFPKMVFVGESFPRMVCVGGVCQGFVSRERWFVSEGWSWTTCDKSKGFQLYVRLDTT